MREAAAPPCVEVITFFDGAVVGVDCYCHGRIVPEEAPSPPCAPPLRWDGRAILLAVSPGMKGTLSSGNRQWPVAEWLTTPGATRRLGNGLPGIPLSAGMVADVVV